VGVSNPRRLSLRARLALALAILFGRFDALIAAMNRANRLRIEREQRGGEGAR
jgi:hypothetical protein